MQIDMFSAGQQPQRWQRVPFSGADIWLRHEFIPADEATQILDRLVQSVPWRHDTIRIFGTLHDIPRLQQWYGDQGAVYRWSGIEMDPLPWTDEMLALRERVERATKRRFNSVLLNYYRGGDDCVGWHSDDEDGLGPSPFIASLSLGAERDFQIRCIADKRQKTSFILPHGSLLVMAGDTQANTEHALPRRARCDKPRINATWRQFEIR